MKEKLRLLLAYAHYPCSMGLYWKEGLRQLGHQVDSIGPCTGNKIPWGGGIVMPSADEPTHPALPFANRYQVDDGLRALSQNYDIFINVDASHYWAGSLPIPKVIIGTDPHCIQYTEQRQDCDLFVCMQKTYSKPGDTWIPYAYLEGVHFNTMVTRTHHIGFVGVEYAHRKSDLDFLQSNGLRVLRRVGPVMREYSDLMSQCYFSYCRPSEKDLPTRFFESLAIGSIPVLPPIQELSFLECLEEDKHYLTFSTTMELLQRVRRLVLAHEQGSTRLLEMIQAGKEWVEPHSWRNRAQQLLGVAEDRGLL